MGSKWARKTSFDDAPPVELRFVDMFMAAVGSLIFIALIYSILPRKINIEGLQELEKQFLREIVDKREREIAALKKQAVDMVSLNERLKKDIDRLNGNRLEGCAIAPCSTKAIKKGKEERWPTDVVSRWFRANISYKTCLGAPVLYVREEGELINLYTDKPMGYAEELDASNPLNRTELYGEEYAANNDEFDGVLIGNHAVYIALNDPVAQGERTCNVEFRYKFLGSGGGKIFQVVLTMKHPYSFLGRMVVDEQGSLQFHSSFGQGLLIRNELTKFSAKQAKLLCKKDNKLCGSTMASVISR